MDLIYLVLGLAIIGMILYYIERIPNIDSWFIWLIRVIVAIVVILYLIRMFGSMIPNVLPHS